MLNAISVLRKFWKCFPYQGSYGLDAPLDRASRNSKPKHVPCLKFLGPCEQPTVFETRNCYPTLPKEKQEATLARLLSLKSQTVLSIPSSHVCYAYDPKMELHHCQTESAHPERPARTREIIKLLKEKSMLARMSPVKCRNVSREELQRIHSSELVSLLHSVPSKSQAELHSLQDKYTSIYFHLDTLTSASLAAGSLIEVCNTFLKGV